MQAYDHLLIVGFGAPERIEDVEEFLRIVASGRNIPEERLKEVKHHYELIGGGSPYNRAALELASSVERDMRARGIDLPVYTGMRNWNPFLNDTIAEIAERGHEKGIAVILSPFRSPASCARYKKNVVEAVKNSGRAISYDYAEEWIFDSRFICLEGELLGTVLNSVKDSDAHVFFSAHSIPSEMNDDCASCDYAQEHERLSAAIARAVSLKSWSVCYQSRSGNPRERWLEPDINRALLSLKERGQKTAVVVPIGFMLDNAEVLYDLDMEAAETCRRLGLDFFRIPTISKHPGFPEAFGFWLMGRTH